MAGIAFEGGIDLFNPCSAFVNLVLSNETAQCRRMKPATVVGAKQVEKTYREESDGIDRFPVCVGVRHDYGCSMLIELRAGES